MRVIREDISSSSDESNLSGVFFLLLFQDCYFSLDFIIKGLKVFITVLIQI